MFRLLGEDPLHLWDLIGDEDAVAAVGVFARLDNPNCAVQIFLLNVKLEFGQLVESQGNVVKRILLVEFIVSLKIVEKGFFIRDLEVILQMVMHSSDHLYALVNYAEVLRG